MVMVDEVRAEKYIAALDVGTTTIRCHIFDQNAQIKGTATDQVNLKNDFEAGFCVQECLRFFLKFFLGGIVISSVGFCRDRS